MIWWRQEEEMNAGESTAEARTCIQEIPGRVAIPLIATTV